MKYLIIVNDGPYGSERAYNALRLAMNLQTEAAADVSISLVGDAVHNASAGQKTPDGYYNMERMLKAVIAKNGQVKV